MKFSVSPVNRPTRVLAALVLSWRLLAPGDGWVRAALLLMLLAVEPVRYGLWLGQIVPLQMAALALAYVALVKGRDHTAGVLLAAIADPDRHDGPAVDRSSAAAAWSGSDPIATGCRAIG